MAKCGMEKYDDLPGRVGWIDVDALRNALYRLDHPLIEIKKIPVLRNFATPPEGIQKFKETIVEKLDKAYEAEYRGGKTIWTDLFTW